MQRECSLLVPISHCEDTRDGYTVPGMPRKAAAVAWGWQKAQCLVLEGATLEQQRQLPLP